MYLECLRVKQKLNIALEVETKQGKLLSSGYIWNLEVQSCRMYFQEYME